MEAVRIAPDEPGPYKVLSLVYKDLNDELKYLQFGLIAAHLAEQDVDTWKRFGEISE
jgi:hypothetical protein